MMSDAKKAPQRNGTERAAILLLSLGEHRAHRFGRTERENANLRISYHSFNVRITGKFAHHSYQRRFAR